MTELKQGLRPCALALAVALALELSGCGGGGGGNVRPSPAPTPSPTGSAFAGGDINVGSGLVTVWPDNMGGSIDLRKGGAGTLVLTGTNSYTGGTTINDGTLQLGNGGQTGSITGNVADNGSLVFNRSDDVSFNGIISGSGSLTQAGQGTLTLLGANTYTGGTTISHGILQLGNGGQTGSITGNVTDNGSLVFNRSDNVSFSGIISGSGSLTQAGQGTLTLLGANTYTGGTTISHGILQLGNGGQTGSITGNVTDNGSLVFNRSDNVSFSGIVNGSGSLTQAGQGTLTLLGANTYTGGTTISRGILQLGNGGQTGWITGNVTDNGSLVFNRSDDVSFNGIVSGSGSLTQAGPGTLTLLGANTYTGGTTISHGTLQLGNGGQTGSITGNVTDNGSLVFNRSDNVSFNGIVSGSGSLTQAGPGMLTLARANTYTGGTAVNGGTLQIAAAGAPGTGSLTVDNSANQGATLKVLGGVSLSNHILLNHGATLDNAGALVDTADTAPVESSAGAATVLNHDGGHIAGTTVGVLLHDGAAVTNGAGSTISGTAQGIVVSGGDTVTVNNEGSITSSQGDGVFLAGASIAVSNSRGGTIEGGNTGATLFGNGAVSNTGGSVISGNGASGYGVHLLRDGTVGNDGASIKATSGGTGIQADYGAGTIANANGASIEASNLGIWLRAGGTVTNSNGSRIEGGSGGVVMGAGGAITNQGNSVISAQGARGIAVQISGSPGAVNNIDGATITGSSFGVFLDHGGTVINGSGATIETTGTPTSGGCWTTGICGIFVATETDNPGSGWGGALSLTNAGRIVGNVQMDPGAANSVTLTAGGSIGGDLGIGSNPGASLTLNGDAGTAQLYSQAVTGVTTFAGDLSKRGDGAWIIDNNDLTPDTTAINGGALQIGNGGTTGSIGQGDVTLYHGQLVFDRSDDITYNGNISGGYSTAYDGTLVQAGTGTLTLLARNTIRPGNIAIKCGTLQIDNTGNVPGSAVGSDMLDANVVNDGSLVFNSSLNIFYSGAISGTGSVTQNGSATLIMQAANTYTGDTTINSGSLQATNPLFGNVVVNGAGALDGNALYAPTYGFPGASGNLANAGKVSVHGGDSVIGGNYVQSATGTLAVSLGSKLDVAGTATLSGGTLEVTGADSGYVSSTHTNVLTAGGGVSGTFAQLTKDTGVVFTATSINYDATSVWLDTTGLNVTTAAAGQGVTYTAASMGSAVRVQGAFEQLNGDIATGTLTAASGDFLLAAGQFQQSPDLLAAQASLQSLSGELHAATAAMTFESIDASGRVLSDRLDSLSGKQAGFGTWMHDVSLGGDMARAGFDGVGFQLNGWLVGNDRQIGRSGVAGFAFGQSQGQQRLNQSLDRDNNRSTEGMAYAGWLDGNWYTQGRVSVGHLQQDVSRQVLLGTRVQGLGTRYNGRYHAAYAESGLHFGQGANRITPYIDAQYARIDRNGFAEQGAGGFGLRSHAQTIERWQAGLGVRAAHRWNFGSDRALDLSARAQWQRTVAAYGDVFEASFVGLQQWAPLAGIGLSRYNGLFGVGMNATLSAHTMLNFSYDYETGERSNAQMFSARLNVAF